MSGSPLYAAEVKYIHQFDGTPLPDEVARKLWPLGFRPAAGMCEDGYINGEISKGDFEKVRTLFTANHNTLHVFHLSSPGGDVEEAISIGKLFRKYLIRARAPYLIGESFYLANGLAGTLCRGAECVCARACALIWFGAVDREGVVGLHRPRIDDPAFKALPPDEAAKVYRRALDDIDRYMNEMEAPHPMIDAMVATSSSEIRWIDTDTDHDLEHPPSYAEWENATCGEVTADEADKIVNFTVKR
jgi:hypothetical protein